MKRLRAALLNRIGACGDTEISVSARTLEALLDWAGVRSELMGGIRERQERYVCVEAFLLESLVDLSERRVR